MKKFQLLSLLLVVIICITFSFTNQNRSTLYTSLYLEKHNSYTSQILALKQTIEQANLQENNDLEAIKQQIILCRKQLKSVDFWYRYLEPTQYKSLNGPLPVEWETEVFEKFEKPYKREGAGLTLASLYMEEENPKKEELLRLINTSLKSLEVYQADSITQHLTTFHHFYLCNRLYLLNLAAIYTTGFECPDTSRIIPELQDMLKEVGNIYLVFNENFPETPLPQNYIQLYQNTLKFVINQPREYSHFEHFTFIKDYVNPLFVMNQKLINDYHVVSKSNVDYALNKRSTSIFDKSLYHGQNAKGVFLRVKDKTVLEEIEHVGKLLFYDPLLSANNQRSCVSCHQPTEYFSDTSTRTSLQFDGKSHLARNTPSLINVGFNHLVMMDGKHITLQDQTQAVLTHPNEMASNPEEILTKILSCEDYKTAFKKFIKLTPQEPKLSLAHINSAITLYYSKFSNHYSAFDDAMDRQILLDAAAQRGFNLFMSKAQCATCHFVPNFNGVKPPYVGSEFEVLGVPSDNSYASLSTDLGRYEVNPAVETRNAFRTGTLRNTAHTQPYMHNGSFTNLMEVIDFYDGGGGAGRGLKVDNQTLSSDSLHLSTSEKSDLIAFIQSLDEKIAFEAPPLQLPKSKNKHLNNRKVGGTY